MKKRERFVCMTSFEIRNPFQFHLYTIINLFKFSPRKWFLLTLWAEFCSGKGVICLYLMKIASFCFFLPSLWFSLIGYSKLWRDAYLFYIYDPVSKGNLLITSKLNFLSLCGGLDNHSKFISIFTWTAKDFIF